MVTHYDKNHFPAKQPTNGKSVINGTNGIRLPDSKAVSGEIIVADEAPLTVNEIRRKIFEYTAILSSRSPDSPCILRGLIDSHPSDESLMIALEKELKTRGLLNKCLSPFSK